jgi:multidrug efflux system outer membrane protein
MHPRLSPASTTALALSLSMALAACSTMAPTYERPAAPVSTTWPTGEAYTVAAPSDRSAPDVPWQSFILDARLRAVVEKALVNNRSLRETVARIESARAQYGTQRAAQWPTVSAGVSGSRARSLNSAGGAANSTVVSQSYQASAGISAYELDLFGRVRSLSDAALESYLATEEASRAARISLIAETATAWLTFAADRSRLAISQKTLVAAQRTMELTRQRLALGVDTRLDLRSAETVFQQARADVAKTTTAIAQDRNALDLLVGAPVEDASLPSELPAAATWLAEVPAGLSSEVLLRRPDVLQAEHQLKAANANIGAARAAFFPSVSLTAAGGVASAALSTLVSGGATVWSLAPALSVPIFDGGANRANLGYATAQQRLYVSTYELAVQTAFREVADALAQQGTMNEQLSAQNALVAASEDSYVLASRRYLSGADSSLSALVSQRTLYSAQLALVAAQLTALDNRVMLYRSLGGGVKSDS